jgi:ectoine hydroxylase
MNEQTLTSESMDKIKEDFLRDGAVILPGFFPAEELRDADAQLDRYGDEPVVARSSEFQQKTYTDTQAWAPVETGVACMITLRDHARLRQLTEAVIGAGFHDEPSLVMLTRKGKAQAWHQDTSSDKQGEFILNRLIYSRDTPRAAGALVFVPGSHRRGEIPPGGPQDPIAGEVAIEPRAGTVALVSSRCFHRVTPNETNLPRFSINFRVRPATAPANLGGVGVYRTVKWDFRTGKQA